MSREHKSSGTPMNTTTSSLKTIEISPRKGEMIKPREIIGIAGMESWSLVDRRCWNLLLLNAWGDKLEDPTSSFTIPIRELRGLHDSNDRVRSCLRKLQTTLVSARLANGKTRTVQLLGSTDLGDDDRVEGELRYDFHPKLVPLLRESEIYARMETKLISSFSSKYGLALYEAISARIQLRMAAEIITVEELRQWLGVEENRLGRWSDLNRKAVQVALSEVNGLSPYSVEIEPIKRGRKTRDVKVSWSKKEPFSPAEQAAAREVNRAKVGRKSRLNGTSEQVVLTVPQLSATTLQKGYDAAKHIERIDKHNVYEEWKEMVSTFSKLPDNPNGHFIDFCKKVAQREKTGKPLYEN